MKFILSAFSIVVLLVILSACEKIAPDCGCVAPPISSSLMGKWEWVKTITPSDTITPETVGYEQTFQFDNDGKNNFIAFYKNDSLTLRLVPVQSAYQEDVQENSFIEQYGSQFLKYYLKKGTYNWPTEHEMQTSEFLPSRDATGTSRHHYRYLGR